MKSILTRFLFILVLLPAKNATAQTNLLLNFQRINYDQGLSNSTIEAIIQDHRGFIWIGTRDGLNKYDGYQMSVYRNRKNDPASISDNYIKFIYEDREGVLWIGTINGLNRFDEASQTFKSYHNEPGNSNSISGNTVNCILEDSKKNLWICTNAGLNLFDRKNKKFSRFLHSEKESLLKSDLVNYIKEDRKGNLWVGTSNGLDRYEPKNKHFTNCLKGYSSIKSIQEDATGKLWMATEGSGLVVFDPVEKAVSNYRHQDAVVGSLGNDLVLSLLLDKKDRIWAGTINGGLNLFQPDTKSFINYTNDPGNPFSLSQRTISALFEDRQSNLWIGTHRGGINLFTPAANKFEVYRQEPQSGSLSYNDVKCFEEDHLGRIWIGTDGGGLNLFNPINRSFKHFRQRNNDLSSLGADAILDITEDRSHRIWISTWGGGLNLMNPQTQTFIRFKNDPTDPRSISSNFVQNTFQDTKGNLWVGTYFGGLNQFDPATRKFKRIIYAADGKSSLQGNNIVALNEDKEGNLWVGTDDGGLNCLNARTQQFEHYFNLEDKKPDIRVIFQDSKGRLWIGQEGLYLFNSKQKKFTLFTANAALDHVFIKGIAEDKKGILWISTSAGLISLNPDNLHTRSFNTNDGLQAMEFEANACMSTRNGQLFFGGVNGFNTFYPQNIQRNNWVPPVYITGFQIFNQDIKVNDKNSPLIHDISLTRNIELNHKQSSISFTFSALNYLARENNQYAYMLKGFDKDWNLSGNGRKATYTNLNPGKYTFFVKAANNDGLWNEKGTSIEILINPPWWQTWWFKLIVLMLTLGSAYAIHIQRKNVQIRKLNEVKREELHQMQLQFFTNISHEFRTPLTLILGPLEKMMNTEKRTEILNSYNQILRNAKRLMNLINELMDFRKVESGILKLKVIPGNINVFVNEITAEFKDWAEQKNVKFLVQNTPQPSPSIYFDRQVLEKILLNLINNSFKYTPDGGTIEVKLLFSADEFSPSFANELKISNPYPAKKYLYIVVADSGIGISAESIEHLFQRYYRITSSHLGSGIGLAFVKTLTILHKGHITVFSERNKGTEILVALPYTEDEFTADERWISDDKNLLLESMNAEWQTAHAPTEVQATTVQAEISRPEEQTATTADKKILLVEDNVELRIFLKDSLKAFYQIIEAGDGHQGYTAAKEHKPHLIISDVMMPGMDGIDLCKLIRKDETVSHIPIILLTAMDALESKIEGIGSGADFYFSKPVSINLLLLTIRNIFSHEAQLKERHVLDYYSEIKETAHADKDKQFIDQLVALVEAQLINPDLDVDYLCGELNMSRTKLYELIKRISGQSIIEFIRTIRLNRAMQMMIHEELSLSEVMFRVGIQTQSYFTKAFKKEFGKTPSQFLKELKR